MKKVEKADAFSMLRFKFAVGFELGCERGGRDAFGVEACKTG